MRYVLAFFCPWLTFVTMGKFGRAFLCFLLQWTIFGWLPAVIWAGSSVGGYNADKRTDRVVDAINKNNAAAKPATSARTIPEHVPPSRSDEAARPIPTVETYFRSQAAGPTPRASLAADASKPASERSSPPERSYDERKWRALIRFDDEIAAAAKRARGFGADCEDELARSYLRLNDKSYLDALLDKIAKEARAQSA
jgi:uncharacterized membrane protein YqaE (UPF0057 family)